MRSSSAAAGTAFALAALIAGCAKPRPATPAAPAPDPLQQLRLDIDTLLDQPGHERGLWGVAIHSLARDERIYERNPRTLLLPASTMKLVSLAAAAEAVGWDFAFETRLVASGPVVNGSLEGDLVIVGSGDPSVLGRPQVGSLAPWVDALRAAGITRVNGRVVGDDDAQQEPRPGFGWSWEDLGYTYGSIPGALNLAENIVDVTVSPAHLEGLPAVVELPANARDLPIVNLTRTAAAGTRESIWPELRPGEAALTLNGTIAVGDKPAVVSMSVGNPTAFFARALRNEILAAGIDVTGAAVDIDDVRGSPSSGLALWSSPSGLPADRALWSSPSGLPTDRALWGSPSGLPADRAMWSNPSGLPTGRALRGSPSGLPADRAVWSSPSGVPADRAVWSSPSGVPADRALWSSPSGLPAGRALWSSPSGLPAGRALWSSPSGLPADRALWSSPSGVPAGRALWSSPSGLPTGRALWSSPSGLPTTPLYTHRSPSLAEIAKPLIKESINLYAEAMLRLATGPNGPRTSDAGLDAVRARLESWGIAKEGIQIVDGSGLSRRNVIAPETLVALMRRFHDASGASPFMQAQAIAGRDGTLSNRMKGTPAEGNALGKTGSLSNVRTFAGYVKTADGEPLVVVIMANNFEGPASGATATIDKVLARLASFARPN